MERQITEKQYEAIMYVLIDYRNHMEIKTIRYRDHPGWRAKYTHKKEVAEALINELYDAFEGEE